MSFLAEGFGYLASLLLALSLLVNNDLRFRWLNTGGCIAFIVYGILIHAFPIILTNSILLLINLYSLLKIYKQKELFDLVEFEAGNPLAQKFFAFYADDLHSYFPEFDANQTGTLRFMVLRNMAIANVFIAHVKEGTAEVLLNYTVPKYRDFKVGSFIFEKNKNVLLSKGVKKVQYKKVANKKHEHFLQVTGFATSDSGAHLYLF